MSLLNLFKKTLINIKLLVLIESIFFKGKLASKDRVIVISHSGNTDEIINVIEHIKVKNVPVIAILGNSGEH